MTTTKHTTPEGEPLPPRFNLTLERQVTPTFSEEYVEQYLSLQEHNAILQRILAERDTLLRRCLHVIEKEFGGNGEDYKNEAEPWKLQGEINELLSESFGLEKGGEK